MLQRYFQLTQNNTTVKTEIIAGITTFMTMAYILAVNPEILSATGMDKNAVFTATALSSLIATLVMALVARLPFALAPGMGLNAFFAYTVVMGMGYDWKFALTAVFLEGIIFMLLTAFNIRELIVNAIPISMKHAVSAGIGLFIAFIGLQHAGIVVNNEATLVG
ncbi:MAG TPA: NCS2 family permease, partial [Draconibacterium sp.]|nr:NCS2 family permease [Draconibacterium sp.]